MLGQIKKGQLLRECVHARRRRCWPPSGNAARHRQAQGRSAAWGSPARRPTPQTGTQSRMAGAALVVRPAQVAEGIVLAAAALVVAAAVAAAAGVAAAVAAAVVAAAVGCPLWRRAESDGRRAGLAAACAGDDASR